MRRRAHPAADCAGARASAVVRSRGHRSSVRTEGARLPGAKMLRQLPLSSSHCEVHGAGMALGTSLFWSRASWQQICTAGLCPTLSDNCAGCAAPTQHALRSRYQFARRRWPPGTCLGENDTKTRSRCFLGQPEFLSQFSRTEFQWRERCGLGLDDRPVAESSREGRARAS